MAQRRTPKFFCGYIVVVAAFLVMVVMWGTYYSFGVFFKPLLAEFGWTRAMTSVAYSLSFLLSGFLGIVAGKLTDRFGSRIVITGCGLFLGLGYLLVSQASAIWQIYLFYGVMIGVGMSGSFVPLVSTVAMWFVKRRGMMTGITVAGLSVGTLIVPPIVNWLISIYGWRSAYVIVGIMALVLIILAAQFLKRDPRQIGQLPYGANELEEKEYSQTTGFSLREAVPTKQFWMLGAVLLCYGWYNGTIHVHIVPHAIGLRVSAASAAMILAIIGGAGTVGRVTMGSIGDRLGNRKTLIIGSVLVLIALLWLLAAKELWMFYLFAIIAGFGAGGMAALVSPTVAEQFGLGSHGVILGVIMLGVTIGNAIGPIIAGHIFDIIGSYNPAFLICAAVITTALILILLLRPTRGRE